MSLLNKNVMRLKEIVLQIKEKEDELKELKKRKENLQNEIRLLLETNGLDKVNINGVTVYKRDDVYMSLPKEPEKRLEALLWLEENGLSHIIETTVNAKRLSSTLKEKAEDESVKKIFNIFIKRTIGVRGCSK